MYVRMYIYMTKATFIIFFDITCYVFVFSLRMKTKAGGNHICLLIFKSSVSSIVLAM